MYVQELFNERRREVLTHFITQYPLGVIVSTRADGLEADREGVVAGLRAENTDAARAIADWMVAYGPPPKDTI